jgi:hypothetical protein
MKRSPTSLDKYPQTYFKLIERVRENGKQNLTFSSNLIATSARYKIYELFRSIAAYSDDDGLKEDVKFMSITWRKDEKWLTVFDKRHQLECQEMENIFVVENGLREVGGEGTYIASDDDILSASQFG